MGTDFNIVKYHNVLKVFMNKTTLKCRSAYNDHFKGLKIKFYYWGKD